MSLFTYLHDLFHRDTLIADEHLSNQGNIMEEVKQHVEAALVAIEGEIESVVTQLVKEKLLDLQTVLNEALIPPAGLAEASNESEASETPADPNAALAAPAVPPADSAADVPAETPAASDSAPPADVVTPPANGSAAVTDEAGNVVTDPNAPR